jgi:diacylglycerol kinase family enzyme
VAGKVKGKVNAVTDSIHAFFQEYPHMRYQIHVTRWERDALCVVRHKAEGADELLRVHIMGGSGTLSEAVNAVVSLPNVQVAAYPFGNENCFLQYFGSDKVHLFSSIRSQVFSDTTPIDVIKSGGMHGISHALVGLEAAAGKAGFDLYENSTVLTQGIANIIAGVRTAFGKWIYGQKYNVTIDGQVFDGIYVSMLVANGPCYSKNMRPAADAHPNDGLLDIYMLKRFPRLKLLFVMRRYLTGRYRKYPDYISHHRGTKVSVSSEAPMNVTIDDKNMLEASVGYEVLPYAIDFVCPGGIDIEKLPRVYNT